MYTGLVHLHSLLRWLVLILLVWAIIRAIAGLSSGQKFTDKTRKFFSFTMIIVHVQVLLGLIMYFMSPVVKGAMQIEGMMKDTVARYWVIEHMAGMIVAAIIITAGYSRAKRLAEDSRKFRTLAIMFVLGFILIVATITWPFRAVGVARSLFPGL